LYEVQTANMVTLLLKNYIGLFRLIKKLTLLFCYFNFSTQNIFKTRG